MKIYKHKCVMVVDDVDLDNFVSKTTITTYGFSKTVYVQNGADTAIDFLKKIKEHSDQAFPSVIFIDINMPVVNGFQFIEKLKRELEDELAAHHPKLVMLTSSIFDSDRQKAKESFEDIIFIVKPLSEETLRLI